MDLLKTIFCCCFKSKKAVKENDNKTEKLVPVEVDMSMVSGKLEMDGTPGEELATLGAGCYWGTERYIVTKLGSKHPGAILGNAVGFMSPNENAVANPKYRQVCGGDTTHVEVLHVRFDNTKLSFEELVRYFFTFHDPTTWNKQGND